VRKLARGGDEACRRLGPGLDGYVRDTNGTPIAGATVTVGERTAASDLGGHYGFLRLQSGAATVTAAATGFLSDSETVTVSASGSVERTFALSQRVAAGQTRIVLTWGSTPRDLDSHLWVPSGSTRTEIYYSSRGNAAAAPFAALDVDDRDGSGPETTTVALASS